MGTNADVEPIAFSLCLAGQVVHLDGTSFWVETHEVREPSCGGRRQLAGIGGGSASCRRQLELWDDGSLMQTGELDFGAGDALTFRARGALGVSADPHRRHGTAVLEVTGGHGRLVGARGYVTSNFLLADTGELMDHQLGLLFLHRDASTPTGGTKEETP